MMTLSFLLGSSIIPTEYWSGSIERSKADLEKFKRSIRRCKIEFLQSGCQGTASPGVADPMEIGLASPWAKPKEIGAAVWLGQSPWEDRYLRKMGPTIS